MTKRLVLISALLTMATAIGLGAAALASADPAGPYGRGDPPRPVIIKVTGDGANGFGITYAGGGSIYPPTDSEARAECSEYDTRAARVRCRTEVRTWYRDLGDLQRSLAWVRAHDG